MRKADKLSGRLDLKVGVENNNENWKWIKKTREKYEEVVKVVKEIKKVGVKILREDEWEIERDLILKEEKIYVPKNEKLKLEVI